MFNNTLFTTIFITSLTLTSFSPTQASALELSPVNFVTPNTRAPNILHTTNPHLDRIFQTFEITKIIKLTFDHHLANYPLEIISTPPTCQLYPTSLPSEILCLITSTNLAVLVPSIPVNRSVFELCITSDGVDPLYKTHLCSPYLAIRPSSAFTDTHYDNIIQLCTKHISYDPTSLDQIISYINMYREMYKLVSDTLTYFKLISSQSPYHYIDNHLRLYPSPLFLTSRKLLNTTNFTNSLTTLFSDLRITSIIIVMHITSPENYQLQSDYQPQEDIFLLNIRNILIPLIREALSPDYITQLLNSCIPIIKITDVEFKQSTNPHLYPHTNHNPPYKLLKQFFYPYKPS